MASVGFTNNGRLTRARAINPSPARTIVVHAIVRAPGDEPALAFRIARATSWVREPETRRNEEPTLTGLALGAELLSARCGRLIPPPSARASADARRSVCRDHRPGSAGRESRVHGTES